MTNCRKRTIPTAVLGLLLACGPALAADSPAADERPDTIPRLLPLTVELQLESDSQLKPEDVTYSVFPGGRRCAFTYKGPRLAATVAALTEMGFRATIHVSPRSDAAHVRGLEAAGAEIAVGGYWGAKGTYSSMIGANTVQEAYDAIVTSRMAVKKLCTGPVACGSVSGHIDHERFPFIRDVERGCGYGAALHDANLLQTNEISGDAQYAVMLGRRRRPRVTMRGRFSNIIRDPRKVPNEKVYYQMLAHQFLGTLARVERGQVIQYSLRDFKAKDLRSIRRIMGKYGKHALIWHATEGMISSYEYQKKKVHVRGVDPVAGGGLRIALGIEEDLFAPFLLSPLSLELPGELGVKGATAAGVACTVGKAEDKLHVQVPLQKVLRDGVEMGLTAAAADMTVPDEMAATLTVRNTSAEALESASLRWVGCPGLDGGEGMTISGGPEGQFTIQPGGQMKVQVTVRTAPGAHFGLTPIVAIVTGRRGGMQRLFMEGFEIAAAPMLGVNVLPYNQVPMLKGRSQHVIVNIDNLKEAPGGEQVKFICHKAGPCRGAVSFEVPEGMEVAPASLPFELKADDSATLVFRLTSKAWSPQPVRIPPVITIEGVPEPIRYPYPGTRILRDKATLDYTPLDKQGLLAYASWDDKGKCGFDRSVGVGYVGHGGLGSKIGVNWTPIIDGAKGWCIGAQSAVLADSFKNIDYRKGTVLCWIRRDLHIRNENQYRADPSTSWKRGAVNFANNYGETIWVTGGGAQNIRRSQSGLTLRRYYGWDGKEGYLEAIWQGMGMQLRYAHAPYENARLMQWRHVAVLWDIDSRRLELYVDGKLAGKAEPGEQDWYGCPWDNGVPPSGGRAHCLQPISMDHGKRTWTMRDEFYIYNRPLRLEEIRANMARAKQAG